jgi:CRISPR-associated protein Csx10
MHLQSFVIELLEDLVISQRAATLGGHKGLDYVPGQTLLGACAARLYRSLGSQAYAVFHSGAVRFGNTYCLDPRGRPAWPMPLCLHRKKGESPKEEGAERLDPEKVFNLPFDEDELCDSQPKQLREGYVNTRGDLVNPGRAMRMKTAIEPGTGRAAEAQLFGYDALARGTRLGGWIEADDSIDKTLFDDIVAALTEPMLLGRSRSAEYGHARFEAADPGFALPSSGPLADGELTLWLLSDLALTDKDGQPSLDPDPTQLGLGAGAVDWGATFLRTRRYAPWNGKRRSPDLERWVLQQGSVIRLRLYGDPDPTALLEMCTAGLGLYRECGLGRVWVNPPLLVELQQTISKERAAAEDLHPDTTAKAGDDPVAKDPLIVWLRSQVETEGSRERMDTQARAIAAEYQERLAAARRELGISSDELFGPSRSQWGGVLETARGSRPDRLLEDLFETGDAVVKRDAEGWKEEFFDGRRRVKLADWLKASLEEWIAKEELPEVAVRDLPRLVQRLAHLCRTDTERRAQ